MLISFRHKVHRFVAVLHDWCIPRISHNASTFQFCSFSFQISLESSAQCVCFAFCFFKRFLMVCVSWLELSLTDAVVKFISIILCCRSYICLVHKVLLLRHLLFKGHLDLFIHICSCLSWWLWVCHCLVMYVDSWFHVWHTTVANFHIFSIGNFQKTYGVVESVCNCIYKED